VSIDLYENTHALYVGSIPDYTTQSYTAANFDLPPAPFIAGCIPSFGRPEGGDEVIIQGQNFDKVTAVYFNSSPVSSFQILNDSALLVTTPPWDGGNEKAIIRVVTPWNEGTRSTIFEYYAANRRPLLSSIGGKVGMETKPLSFSVSATDPDGDPLVFSAELTNGGTLSTIGATFTDNGNGTGTFNWTPTLGQAGDYSVQFIVADSLGLSDTETIIITVDHLIDIASVDPQGGQAFVQITFTGILQQSTDFINWVNVSPQPTSPWVTPADQSMMFFRASPGGKTVGYNRITIPGNTDVRLSLPFSQNAEGTFSVSTATASGVTVANTLTPGAYANSYYVRFTSGNGAGLWSTISNNGTNSLDLADLGLLNYVNSGDTFRVYRHHTLGSVFPNSLFNVSYTSGSKILIYENNLAAMSQNKAAVNTATYITSGGGMWVGAGVSNNTILKPETQFILRNNASPQFQVITLGAVPDYSVSMLIAPNGDLVIGSGYPVPVVLRDSGLAGNLQKVLFYDNNAVGQNKAANKTATYSSGSGTWVGAGVTGNELISASEAVTLRLPVGETGTKATIPKPF
jgi:uncharacterized protein (TIGR02597 family)